MTNLLDKKRTANKKSKTEAAHQKWNKHKRKTQNNGYPLLCNGLFFVKGWMSLFWIIMIIFQLAFIIA